MLVLSIASPGSGRYGKNESIARTTSSKARRPSTIAVAMAWRGVIRRLRRKQDGHSFYASRTPRMAESVAGTGIRGYPGSSLTIFNSPDRGKS